MISPALGEISRPIADISIQTVSGKWIKFRPFIDSGADISIIPHSVGKYLGFEMEDKIVEFGGVSGKHLPVIIKKMKMRIGDIELEPRVGWALIEEAPPLLGRLDIFDKFNITFKEKEEIVLFELV
ncbi:MAG: hypothetical protein JSV56_00770 [Methanomassiliicoccales archaeon]|nr:MAG: hypothetical protein JSV56_00770 [Methanomassiliicoccales archaeon]